MEANINVMRIIELHPGGAVLDMTCKTTWIVIKKEKENNINEIGKNIFNGKSVVDNNALSKYPYHTFSLNKGNFDLSAPSFLGSLWYSNTLNG